MVCLVLQCLTFWKCLHLKLVTFGFGAFDWMWLLNGTRQDYFWLKLILEWELGLIGSTYRSRFCSLTRFLLLLSPLQLTPVEQGLTVTTAQSDELYLCAWQLEYALQDRTSDTEVWCDLWSFKHKTNNTCRATQIITIVSFLWAAQGSVASSFEQWDDLNISLIIVVAWKTIIRWITRRRNWTL